MKDKAAGRFVHLWKRLLGKRLLAIAAAVSMLAAFMPARGATAADTGGTVNSGNQVQIYETVTNGFTHPGVGLTKSILENMRAQVLAQKEPWYSYYKAMTVSSAASKTVTSSNQSSTDPTKPATDAFNSQGVQSRFISDGLKAYTQALMYYITGDETYRANAMRIIRIWSQMDPAKYAYYTDAHIHAGFPLNRMVTAAEILRYSAVKRRSLRGRSRIRPILRTT
ncbi:alginate lyase family protein [Paenibacillus hamazuiensis]|uniref:alginate lyase family protein n=1 Tax=Paenibacillus hamazuiensis TaxID=2936508 RepID=UPI00200E629B|nr:alginate lyase family protein [Paenibacillus hamazuiensis]